MATNGPNVYQRVLDVLPDGSTLFAAPYAASELRHGHTFTLEIEIGYSPSGDHSVDITFAVVKVAWNGIVPPRDKIETHFREFIATIGPELAHNSEQLTCFGCGTDFSYLSLKDYRLCIHAGIDPARPATDFAWVSLYDPNGVDYRLCIHAGIDPARPATDFAWVSLYDPNGVVNPGCEKCINHIQESTVKHLERQREKMTSSSSLPVLIASIPRPDGMSSGPSAACLACRKEQTAAPGFSMSQCGKCKLVRFLPRFRLLIASKAEKHNAKHLLIHERMAGFSDWNQLKIGAAGLLSFASAFNQNCTELFASCTITNGAVPSEEKSTQSVHDDREGKTRHALLR
ncbi:hypothetical protein B0H19DRAFT_1072152 [Mycena capillaripes]|nr:hypothetical protein B0H19DRAFT_1072152 [Mycena capillaripes]